MSLLMDALKKAQEAKTKAQDGDAGDTAVAEAPSQLDTASIDDAEFESLLQNKLPTAERAEVASRSASAQISDTPFESELSLALEDVPPVSPGGAEERGAARSYAPKDDLGLQLDEPSTPPAVSEKEPGGLRSAICDDVLDELEKDLAKQPEPKLDAGSIPQQPAAVTAAQSRAPIEVSPPQVPPAKPEPPAHTTNAKAEKPAKEHPRQAARILSATARTPRKATWIRTALLGGGVLLLVAGGGGAYFYSEYQKLSSPAMQIPRPLPGPLLAPPEGAPLAGEVERPVDMPEATAEVAEPVDVTPDTSSSAAPVVVPEEIPAQPPTPRVALAPTTTQQLSSPIPVAEPVSNKRASQELVDPPRPAVEVKRVEPKEDIAFRELSAAYSAYQAGDLNHASDAYRRVLQLIPDNRDALLGLAAIHQANGHADQARALYQKVLRANKHDTVALAGWYSAVGEGDPRAMESELKVLLAREGNVAYLQFALGNAYARQRKWSAAEQAFNAALQLEPAQADYAYNLAVAYDQLSQRSAAARHYELALALDRGAASFDREQVSQRLQLLRASP